jgi:hypothetical protein
MTKATCAECKREITLIKHSGAFRRHMIRRGEVCPGSWKSPNDVSVAVAERQIQQAGNLVSTMLRAWERHFGSSEPGSET